MVRFLLLGCLAALISISYAATRCGGGHSCVTSTAECQGGQCVCTAPYVKGVGNFMCYKKNTVAAESKNDPTLTNFSNETILFPYPCRYLATHVVQELKDRNRDVIGNCEFKIHSFNAKAKGKYYTLGFDIAVKINYDDGRQIKMSGRNWGTAANGVYTFHKEGSMGDWNLHGPWGSDDLAYEDTVNDIELKNYIDDDNNQIVFEFNKCGLRMTLTPYDTKARRNQISIPGLTIAINCAMHPQWQSSEDVMALPPSMDGGKLYGDYQINGLNVEQSMYNRAFEKKYEQTQPNIAADDQTCHQTSDYLAKCNPGKRTKAYEACYWIIKQPRFVRCYDKTDSGKDILMLFGKCVDMFCGDTTCNAVQGMIRTKGCNAVRDIGILEDFMNGDYCP